MKNGKKKTVSFETVFFGAQTRNRTKDTRIFSPLLYLLSYLGMLYRKWSGWQDLNPRPTGPKPVALPSCATPRYKAKFNFMWRRGWDSNPRSLSESLVFKTSSLNHSDTSPSMSSTSYLN